MTEPRLTRVILRLGRNPDAGFPEGSDQEGYVLVAPLDHDGHLDAALWRAHRAACTVRRFSQTQGQDADGWLVHRGSGWFFRYDEDDEGPDEGLSSMRDHRLLVGEYVTVVTDGEALTYRVMEVQELH